jgi:autotransporter translocation and assembly factor TamB
MTGPIWGLESGSTAGSGKARIDLDIGRGIKLRGEADSAKSEEAIAR